MNFATYLTESKYKTEITLENAIEIVKKNCMKGLSSDLYRGGNFDDDKIYHLTTGNTIRRSANTSNHYTIIMDKILSEKDLPLRSKSFICSLDPDVASQFGELMRIIPFDNAKIGVVGDDDLWHATLNTPARKYSFSFEDFAVLMSNNDISDKSYDKIISDIIKSVKELSTEDEDDLDRSEIELMTLFKDIKLDKESIEKHLYTLFDFDKIGFKFYNGATLSNIKDNTSECWISGECLAVNEETYNKIKKAIG